MKLSFLKEESFFIVKEIKMTKDLFNEEQSISFYRILSRL